MDARNQAPRPRNTPYSRPTPLSDTTRGMKCGVSKHSRSTVPIKQSLLQRYHYILDDTRQTRGGEFVHSPVVDPRSSNRLFVVRKATPHLVPASSQTTVSSSSAIKRWIEGEDEDGHEGDNKTMSTSGSRSSSKPVTSGVGPPMISREVAEAVYGPFPRCNDYASGAGPSPLSHEITADVQMEDVQMEEFNDSFEDDVMVYYHAALSSSGHDPVFDTTSPSSGPIECDLEYYDENMEFVELFARTGV